MIYSEDINKICAVCENARRYSDEMYCNIKKQAVPENDTACEKFKYDILKRRVRRMRRLNNNFSADDFTI